MAHEVESMAYANKAPWHGLGKQVRPGLTPQEILCEANLDWKVEKRALMVHGYNTQIDSHYALVRDTDQSVLGICGKEYIPVQNDKAFEFFDKFIKAGHMTMETAGALRGGRWVWALAKIDDQFTLPGDDQVGAHLLLSNPHVWGKSMVIKFSAIRVVCMNTMLMSLNDRFNKFRFPHIKDFDQESMKTAEEALGLARYRMKDFKEQAEFLAAKRFTPATLMEYAAEVFGDLPDEYEEKKIITLKKTSLDYIDVVSSQPGADLKSSAGTWWGALSGVTYMVDHKLGRDSELRVFNSWFGQKEVLKRRALSMALEYAKAA